MFLTLHQFLIKTFIKFEIYLKYTFQVAFLSVHAGLVLLSVGSVLALYGFLQETGNDFYRFVNAYESNVFGTFGNPNYQSAFMGIFSSVALTLIVFSRIQLLLKFPLAGIFNTPATSYEIALGFI